MNRATTVEQNEKKPSAIPARSHPIYKKKDRSTVPTKKTTKSQSTQSQSEQMILAMTMRMVRNVRVMTQVSMMMKMMMKVKVNVSNGLLRWDHLQQDSRPWRRRLPVRRQSRRQDRGLRKPRTKRHLAERMWSLVRWNPWKLPVPKLLLWNQILSKRNQRAHQRRKDPKEIEERWREGKRKRRWRNKESKSSKEKCSPVVHEVLPVCAQPHPQVKGVIRENVEVKIL